MALGIGRASVYRVLEAAAKAPPVLPPPAVRIRLSGDSTAFKDGEELTVTDNEVRFL